jgi:hypothetical protein
MIPGIVDSAVSAARTFTDEFSGTGSFDSLWSATSGTWSRTDGKATSSTAASSYPLLTFNANTKEVSVRSEYGVLATSGWGVSFWVQDSSNWWAAVTDRTFGYSCPSGGSLSGTTCTIPATYVPQTCQYPTTYSCPSGGTLSGTTCYYCAQGEPQGGGCAQCGFFSGTRYECRPYSSYAATATPGAFYDCSYYTGGGSYAATLNYTYQLKLIKSVSGTVSTVGTVDIATTTSGTAGIGYVQVVTTKAGQITASAQMSTGGATSQIINTPSSPTKARRHGLIFAPITNGTQATSIERFVYAPA